MSNYVKCVRVVQHVQVGSVDLYDVELVARNGVVLVNGDTLSSLAIAMKKAKGIAHQLGVSVVQKYVKEEVPE